MELHEFNDWLGRHQKAYPAMMDWFSTLPDQKGTLAIWFDVLKFVTKAHADEATTRMMRGVEPLVKYTNWHDTPRFVSEHADCLKRDARPRPRWSLPEVDREDRFKCAECRDTGIIEVFHGVDVRAVRAGRFDRVCVRSSARACSCELSKRRYAGMFEKGDLQEFNAVTDVAIPKDRCSRTASTLQDDMKLILESDPCGEMTIEEWVNKQ